MSKEIVIPIIKTKIRGDAFKHGTSFMNIDYVKVTRRISTIEKQIDTLYRKWNQFTHETSKRPTHLILNEIDFQFFKAYHHHVLSTTYYSSPFGDRNKFETIFGLKVLITKSKRPSFAWEP